MSDLSLSLTHEPFVIFSLPCPDEGGCDRAASVGIWHPVRVIKPHLPQQTKNINCSASLQWLCPPWEFSLYPCHIQTHWQIFPSWWIAKRILTSFLFSVVRSQTHNSYKSISVSVYDTLVCWVFFSFAYVFSFWKNTFFISLCCLAMTASLYFRHVQ